MRLVVFNKQRESKKDLLKSVLEASPDGIMALRCIRAADGHIEDALSRILKSKDGFIQGYNAEAAVDGEAQVIVGHALTQSSSS